jgi:hypothetical protein
VVAENGRRPLWMIQARMNCHDTAMVKCQGRQCYVTVVRIDGEGGGDEGGGDPGRGPNTPR